VDGGWRDGVWRWSWGEAVVRQAPGAGATSKEAGSEGDDTSKMIQCLMRMRETKRPQAKGVVQKEK
jgi:hypothetical protein